MTTAMTNAATAMNHHRRSPLVSMSSSNNNNAAVSQQEKKKSRRRSKQYKQQQGNLARTLAMDEPQRSAELETVLSERGCYDTPEGVLQRQQALSVLESLLNQWSRSLLAARTTSNNSNSNKWTPRPRVALISFGSYRLGVQRRDADLDVLALCPPHCSRGDFFTSLVQLLNDDERISDLHPIPVAYTPVVKFCIQSIHVDLLFARLQDQTKLLQSPIVVNNLSQSNTNQQYTIDDSDLIGLDEPAMRSLNGARVAQLLVELVPNLETFRVVLRAVKEWARVHGLYSNVLGFLGGINYAILVAYVCRNYPDASAATLVRVFFRTFAQWNWPTPVALTTIATQAPPGVNPLAVWDPRANPRDRLHLMPIITPAYPSMNSAYNVGLPQLRRLQKEIHEADKILDSVQNGTATWKDLFRQNDFFQRHFHFLQLVISASNASDFLEWSRLCESRLRLLIVGLENPDCGVACFPFAKFFLRKYGPQGMCLGEGKSAPDCKQESCFFVGLRFQNGIDHVDLRYCTSDFLQKVNSWEGRRAGMDLGIEHVTKESLPDFVWENEDDETSKLGGKLTPKKSARPPPHRSIPLTTTTNKEASSPPPAREAGAGTPPPTKRNPSVPSPAKRARKSSEDASS